MTCSPLEAKNDSTERILKLYSLADTLATDVEAKNDSTERILKRFLPGGAARGSAKLRTIPQREY